MADEIKIAYDSPALGRTLREFAGTHKGAKWRHYVRLNLNDMVVTAVAKGN